MKEDNLPENAVELGESMLKRLKEAAEERRYIGNGEGGSGL